MPELEDYIVSIKHDLNALEQTEGHQRISITRQIILDKRRPVEEKGRPMFHGRVVHLIRKTSWGMCSCFGFGGGLRREME